MTSGTDGQRERRPPLRRLIGEWKESRRKEGHASGRAHGYRRGTATSVNIHVLRLANMARLKFGFPTADQLVDVLEDTPPERIKENLVTFAESIIECDSGEDLLRRVREWTSGAPSPG